MGIDTLGGEENDDAGGWAAFAEVGDHGDGVGVAVEGDLAFIDHDHHGEQAQFPLVGQQLCWPATVSTFAITLELAAMLAHHLRS